MTEPNPDDGDERDGDDEPDVGADWMDPADDDILEVMRKDHVFSPDHVEEEGVCRGPHASYRCQNLAERGLLKKQAIGMYDITDLGERYLEGEVDPTDLEADDE